MTPFIRKSEGIVNDRWDSFFIRKSEGIVNYRWDSNNYRWHKIFIYAGDITAEITYTRHKWIFPNTPKWGFKYFKDQSFRFSNYTTSGLEFKIRIYFDLPFISGRVDISPEYFNLIPF